MSDLPRLDPVTLRALAAELDAQAVALTDGCRRRAMCRQCRLLHDRSLALAADYRTRAIRAEQVTR